MQIVKGESFKSKERTTHTLTFNTGAKIQNTYLDSAVKRHLNYRNIRYPIALFWHGTCELTVKTKEGFKIPDNIYTQIDTLINTYRTYTDELWKINPRTTIIF